MRQPSSRGDPDAAVLLLPGLGLNATIFPPLGLPTVAVDFNRAVPRSDEGRRPEPGMRPYGRMLDEFVHGVAFWHRERRIMVGHSFGGMLALWWLLAHRGDPLASIRGLVLVATTAGPMYGSVRVRLPGTATPPRRLPVGRLVGWLGRPWIARTVKAMVGDGEPAARIDFRTLERHSALALSVAAWRNTDWRAMHGYQRAMRGFDVRDRLADLDVPTVVLHGTQDLFFPLRAAEELARGLPRAELRVVPDAGHWLPLTHGEEVVRAVGDLLGARD